MLDFVYQVLDTGYWDIMYTRTGKWCLNSLVGEIFQGVFQIFALTGYDRCHSRKVKTLLPYFSVDKGIRLVLLKMTCY